MKLLRRGTFPDKITTYARILVFLFIIFLGVGGAGIGNVTHAAGKKDIVTHAAGKKDIVTHRPTIIGVQEHVENVVVIGNDAEINGTVHDTVVVINGNIHLGANARVGLLIGIGGTLTREKGAHTDETYMVSLGSRFQNSLAVGSAILFAAWTIRLVISVVLVVIPALLAFLLQRWMYKPLSYLETSARRMGMIGLLATVCLIALAVAFAFTVVGIPISFGLLILLVGFGVVGLAISSVWIGKLIASGFVSEKPVWVYGWIGAIFVMAFSNVPLIGPLLLLMVWSIGAGTVTIWLWEALFSKRLQKR